MFSLDISDSSIEGLKLKKGLFGKLSVAAFGRVELEPGIVGKGEILDAEKLAEKLTQIVKKGKISFTVPDLRTFTCRVSLPADVSGSAVQSFLEDKVVQVVPEELKNLAYDFKLIKETKEDKEVLFIGIAKRILAGYLKLFQSLKLSPQIAVPESLAAFEIFGSTIVRDEVVLYVDMGSKTSTLSFFDKFGPFLTLNKTVETKALERELKKANQFLKEKHKKEIKRVVLGGGQSLEIDGEAFSKKTGMWITKADKILTDRLKKIGLKLNLDKYSPVLFLNALGLCLLTQRKEKLNLLRDKAKILAVSGEEKGKGKGEREKSGNLTAEQSEIEKLEEEGKGGKEKEEMGKERDERHSILSRFKPLLIAILPAILSFLVIFALAKKPWQKQEGAEVPPSPTVQPTSVLATPTPSAEFKPEDLKIKILNGSGIAGEAGRAASHLEEKGYQVIETGNADSFDYQETVIKIKKEKKDFLPLLTNDLKTVYTVSSEEIELGEEEDADVVVIVGKK